MLVKDVDIGFSMHLETTQYLLNQRTEFAQTRIKLQKHLIVEAPKCEETDAVLFEWPSAADVMQFTTGEAVRLSGVRFIYNRKHVKAIVSNLSNGFQGDLKQSPLNHPSSLESNKEILPQVDIRKVEVLFKEGVNEDCSQPLEVCAVLLKTEDGNVATEIMGNGYKNQSRTVNLAEHEVLLGFYGSIHAKG